MNRRLKGPVLTLCSLLFICSSAFAQEAEAPSTEPVDAARAAFAVGNDAYSVGDFPVALQSFEESYRLSHRVEMLFNIAQCHDRLAHWSEAKVHYERFIDALPDSPRIDFATTRLAFVSLRLQESQGANAPDAAPNLPLDVAPSDADVPAPPQPSRSLAAPVILLATGGVAVITGAVLWTIARGKFSDLEAACPADVCPADLNGEADSIDRSRAHWGHSTWCWRRHSCGGRAGFGSWRRRR